MTLDYLVSLRNAQPSQPRFAERKSCQVLLSRDRAVKDKMLPMTPFEFTLQLRRDSWAADTDLLNSPPSNIKVPRTDDRYINVRCLTERPQETVVRVEAYAKASAAHDHQVVWIDIKSERKSPLPLEKLIGPLREYPRNASQEHPVDDLLGRARSHRLKDRVPVSF